METHCKCWNANFMQKLKNLILVIVVLIQSVFVSSALAFDWEPDAFRVLEGDLQSDSIVDIYLEPVAETTTAELPYDIVLNVELQPKLGHAVISETTPDFILSYYANASELEGVSWSDASANFSEHFGDFNGDGYQDAYVRPVSLSRNGFIILGFAPGGVPSLFAEIETAQLGDNYSATSNIQIVDANGDGLADIVVTNASAPDQVILSLSAGEFSPALSYPFCTDTSGLIDSDCDQTSDRYDAAVYDAAISDSVESSLTDIPVGVLSGDFTVTQDGKASYHVPIDVVPGIESVEPSVSLIYNQQAGNGMLGVGWTIGGLSEISRCPTTLDQDGYLNAVNFNSSDRFCLNGQRLVEIATGEYRTENETFAKIIASGDIAGAPEFFTVYTAEGEIEVYGGTSNSRRLATANGAVYTWALSSLSDRENNQATYQYHNGTAQGEFWITRIDYPHTSSVRFNYEDRSDVTPEYSAGILTTNAQRLSRIETYYEETLVRNYNIRYTQGESQKSLVRAIQECLRGDDDLCLPETTFDWDLGIPGGEAEFNYQSEAIMSSGVGSLDSHQYLMGDVNADGFVDLVWVRRQGNVLHRTVFLADGQGGLEEQNTESELGFSTGILQAENHTSLMADVNGDGKSDLIWVARHVDTVFRTVYLANAEGNGFDSQGYELDVNPDFSEVLQSKFHAADVNGDGLSDLIWIYHLNNQIFIKTYLAYLQGNTVYLGDVSTFEDQDLSPDFYENYNFAIGDVNGDQKTDLVLSFTYLDKVYRILYLANPAGDGFVKVSQQDDDFELNTQDHKVLLGDVNSDGKADLVWTYIENNRLVRKIYLASRMGTSFVEKLTETDRAINTYYHEDKQVQLSDINGDGRQDLIYTYIDGNSFEWRSYLADINGEAFSYHESGSHLAFSGSAANQYNFGDITGDGKADLVWSYIDGTGDMNRVSFTQRQSYPDHIEHITDGFGNRTSITYEYLANTENYVKATSATYPYRADTGLSYVVTRVEETNGLKNASGEDELNSWDYQYTGALTHLRGRGFVGFASKTVVDNQRDITTTEHYHQAFPLVGEVVHSTVSNGAHVIEEVHNDWQVLAINNASNVHRYLHRQGIEKRNLVTGEEYYGAVVVNTYDHTLGYLDTAQSTTGSEYSNYSVTGEVQSVLTDYDYALNTEDWRIRFVSSETKTFSAPGESDRVIVSTYTPYNDQSTLTLSETDFVGSEIEQTRTYVRDTYGNVTSVTVTGSDIDSGTIEPQVTLVNEYINGIYADVTTDPATHQEQSEFDFRYGSLVKHQDKNDLITDHLIDGFGNVLFTRNPEGVETRKIIELCDDACPTLGVYKVTETVTHAQTTQKGAPDTTAYYDSKQRLIAVETENQDGNPIWELTEYDAIGRVQQESLPFIAGEPIYWTQYQYDELDRVLYVERADGGTTQTEYLTHPTYGTEGRITSVIQDPINGEKTQVSLVYTNAIGQMRASRDANNTLTEYNYDAQGHLREVIVDENLETQVVITSDIAGNKTQLQDPDAGTITFEYDAIGRERRRTYETGDVDQTTLSTYDVLDRLTTREDFDGQNTHQANWTYDPVNGLGLVDTVNGTDYHKQYSYDAFARTKQTNVQLFNETTPKQFNYYYDIFGRALATAYPSDIVVENQYNDNGYHVGVRNAITEAMYWQALVRDAFGNVTHEEFGNGVETERNYDKRNGRIQNINTGINSARQAYQALTYHHDSAGNLVRRQTQRNNSEHIVESFVYDNLNRLNTATTRWAGEVTGRVIDYRYDNLGNIVTKSDVSDINGYIYGGNGGGVHAVSSITHNGQTTSYAYDLKGNMTTRGSQTITYSVFNKPTRILDLIAETQLRYGPERQRFYQWSTDANATTETRYYGNGFELVNKGDWQREKTTVGDFLVITRVTHATQPTQSEDLDYLHKDHLGSVEARSNRFGNFEGRFAYDAWGQRREESWQNPSETFWANINDVTFESTTRGFTGHEHLDSVGLIHMNGRVYDPLIGRFLSPDDYVQFPENSQSYNRYSYVLNNPLSYTDPSGEFIPLVVVGVVWAVKAYDVYTTVKDVHDIVTDDNLSTAQKSMQLGTQAALALVPGKGLIKGFAKAKKALKSLKKPKPPAKPAQVGRKKAKKGSGTDKNTEKPKENSNGNESNNIGCGCFAPGTMVWTEAGLIPIENIQVGDRVAAKSDITQDIAWKAIEKIYHYEHREYFTLVLASGDDVVTLTTTDDHPFWVEHYGWIKTQDLLLGDLVQTAEGKWLEVIHWESQGIVGETFNFEVEGYHTFFVGEEGVWVHNGAPECDPNSRSIGQGKRSVDEIAKKHDGEPTDGGYKFPSKKKAKKAASEISGDLGSEVKKVRRKDYKDKRNTYKDKESNRVIGKESADKKAGYRDDSIGHEFDERPHINAWSESTGTTKRKNAHLYY